MDSIEIVAAARRIHMEFSEWPTLRLSIQQVRRLWHLTDDVSDAAIGCLVTSGFLIFHDGVFLRRGLGRNRRTIRKSKPRAA